LQSASADQQQLESSLTTEEQELGYNFIIVTMGGIYYVEETFTSALSNDTVLFPGALAVFSGGVVTDIQVSQGQLVVDGGIANGTVVYPGNITTGSVIEVSVPGGSAEKSLASGTVLSGGTEAIFPNGVDTNATVYGGGVQEVYGGTAIGTTINSGGTVIVNYGGTLSGNIVDNGSVIFDLISDSSFNGTLTGSGSLVVEGGGDDTAYVGSYGTLVMSGGDAFTGPVTINKGTLELTSATAV
jgi:autotransporter passenger strand-loop-strand repeat protein/autotransporter-associated beta strand protein